MMRVYSSSIVHSSSSSIYCDIYTSKNLLLFASEDNFF